MLRCIIKDTFLYQNRVCLPNCKPRASPRPCSQLKQLGMVKENFMFKSQLPLSERICRESCQFPSKHTVQFPDKSSTGRPCAAGSAGSHGYFRLSHPRIREVEPAEPSAPGGSVAES